LSVKWLTGGSAITDIRVKSLDPSLGIEANL